MHANFLYDIKTARFRRGVTCDLQYFHYEVGDQKTPVNTCEMLCKSEYDVLAISFSGIGSPRDLLETGQTQSVLAEAFGMSQSVLSRLWNGYQKLKMLSKDQNNVVDG